jgi:hypothetical protein
MPSPLGVKVLGITIAPGAITGPVGFTVIVKVTGMPLQPVRFARKLPNEIEL